MIKIEINRSEKVGHIQVNCRNRAELSLELFDLFEGFMHGELKAKFMSAFLAYFSCNNELLSEFKNSVNDPEFIRSIDNMIKRNEELSD